LRVYEKSQISGFSGFAGSPWRMADQANPKNEEATVIPSRKLNLIHKTSTPKKQLQILSPLTILFP
jgi:hypothetical protein